MRNRGRVLVVSALRRDRAWQHPHTDRLSTRLYVERDELPTGPGCNPSNAHLRHRVRAVRAASAAPLSNQLRMYALMAAYALSAVFALFTASLARIAFDEMFFTRNLGLLIWITFWLVLY